MKTLINKFQARMALKGLELVEKAQKVVADERGGVSPLVVMIGLALLLLGIIIAFSGTLRSAISDAINNVISKLNSLN